MEFYVFPTCCVARNPRVCSMAIAMSGMLTHYPLFCKDLRQPAEFWHIAPVTETPTGPILLLMRDPIDKFLSSVAAAEIDVKTAIDNLAVGKGDSHFDPQAEFAAVATNIYKYPDQLQEFCKAAGLPFPLPVVNETIVDKAVLSADQLAAVQQHYAADIVAFNSIPSVANGTIE